MSAILSGFTILFLFWSITHFARKIVQKNALTLDTQQIFTIMAPVPSVPWLILSAIHSGTVPWKVKYMVLLLFLPPWFSGPF